MIVHTTEPVALIGAGELSQKTLKTALTLVSKIIAADGGASAALGFGITPDVVIGDMDSLDHTTATTLDPATVHHIPEQDSTDFEKVLQRVEAPLLLGVGFLGARVDHQLACFATLTRYPDKRIVLMGEVDIVFLAPPTLMLDIPAETRVSLFPMGKVSGTSTGLNWPIDGLVFEPAGQIGTSNHATGPVTLRVDAPLMLVIVPSDQLAAVLDAITPAAPWPVHAG
jgi:thiamine pyrophosphokinase